MSMNSSRVVKLALMAAFSVAVVGCGQKAGPAAEVSNELIKPVASVQTAAAPAAAPAGEAAPAAAAAAPDGKKIFDTTCAACHATGAAGAPKVGDKAAWGPRIAQGAPALVKSALNGKNAMPPKGGNAGLSEADIKATVEYMVGQSK